MAEDCTAHLSALCAEVSGEGTSVAWRRGGMPVVLLSQSIAAACHGDACAIEAELSGLEDNLPAQLMPAWPLFGRGAISRRYPSCRSHSRQGRSVAPPLRPHPLQHQRRLPARPRAWLVSAPVLRLLPRAA
eukprot:COSAG03_NODE_274_length_9561_cov_13.502114_2_plen_131_part_00